MAYQDDIKKVATLLLPWDKLSGCNVLVTGATGLIGGCLVDVLMAHENKDYNVYASGRNEERAKNRFLRYVNDKTFHFFKYDVMQPLVCDVDFQYIIHAASGACPASENTLSTPECLACTAFADSGTLHPYPGRIQRIHHEFKQGVFQSGPTHESCSH